MLYLPAIYFLLTKAPIPLSLTLLFATWVTYSIIFIYISPQRQIERAISQLIAGISLLDSLILAASSNTQSLLLTLIAFGLTLLLQRYVKGT